MRAPILTFRGPCFEERDLIKHLLCARLDAGHLTYVILNLVLTIIQERAIIMSVNSLIE